ncbi:hypothetical protein PMAYCL1PPCAC_04711, partial [Pristionchus mayeri]
QFQMSEDKCAQLWSKFNLRYCKASAHAKGVDGYIGHNLKLINEALYTVGNGIYRNWDGSWSYNHSAKDVELQKSSTMATFREVQHSLIVLMDLFYQRFTDPTSWPLNTADERRARLKRLRNENDTTVAPNSAQMHVASTKSRVVNESHNDILTRLQISEVRRQAKAVPAQLNSSGPLAVMKRQLPRIPMSASDDSKEIKEEPADDDYNCGEAGSSSGPGVSGPPTLSKEEPLKNEALDEIKNYGEPGPSNGFRRVLKDAEEVKMEPEEDIKHEPMEDVFCPATGASRPSQPTNSNMSNEDPNVVRCFLCYKLYCKPVPRTRITPVQPSERAYFLKRVVPTCDEDVGRLEELGKGRSREFICSAHIVNRYGVLPQDAEKQKEQLQQRLSVPTNFKPTFNRDKLAAMNLPPVPRIEPRKCGLCLKPANRYHYTPVEEQAAKRFFDMMLNITPEERAICEANVKNQKRMRICSDHLLVPPKPRRWLTAAERAILKQNDVPVPREAHNQNSTTPIVKKPVERLVEQPSVKEDKGVMQIEVPEVIVAQGSSKRKTKLQEIHGADDVFGEEREERLTDYAIC